MKRIFFIMFFFLFFLTHSQVTNSNELLFLKTSSKYGENLFKKENVTGTPFLFEKWQPTIIYTDENKKLAFSKGNFLATKNKVLIKLREDFFEIFPDKVKYIVFERQGQKMILAPIDRSLIKDKINPAKKAYYQIFTEDLNQIYVLKENRKKLVSKDVSKSYASDKTFEEMEYRKKSKFYIFNGEKYVRTKPQLKEIIKVLNAKDKYKQLKQFVKQNKLKLRNGYDLQKLMMYYFNELK